jgi:hypothetical protein
VAECLLVGRFSCVGTAKINEKSSSQSTPLSSRLMVPSVYVPNEAHLAVAASASKSEGNPSIGLESKMLNILRLLLSVRFSVIVCEHLVELKIQKV